MNQILVKFIDLFTTILSTYIAFCSICHSQTDPVKSLDTGNAFLEHHTGRIMGGTSWNYSKTYTVLGDTIINGKTFHVLSSPPPGASTSIEYSDSNQLIQYDSGGEHVISDFGWSIDDTVNIYGINYRVAEKGIIDIFYTAQQYMKLNKLSALGGDVLICKIFGVYEYSDHVGFGDSYVSLIGARINGVIYGWPPARVSEQTDLNVRSSVTIYPNPATRNLSVQVKTHQYEKLKIDIFNILGQLVGHIHDGGISDGGSVFNWNGTGADGRTITSGIYFIRVDFGKNVLNNRILYLR